MPGLTTQSKKRRAERPPQIEAGAPRKHQQKKHQRSFDEQCTALTVFKREHTNINVPSQYTKDLALGKWVSMTRASRGTKLTPQQKGKLDQLGFDWETKKQKDEKRWNGMLKKLKRYGRNHLDCNVPRCWPEDPQLGRWVHTQRAKEADNKLPSHHKQQLDAINFQWRQQRAHKVESTANEAKWLLSYQLLAKYREEHGDCLVPQKGKGVAGFELGTWVSTQRMTFRNGKLKEERKQLLDKLGFVYKFDKADLNASRTQKKWDEMFQHLVDFTEKNGHVKVSKRYAKWGLSTWVDTQRMKGRKGSLDQRRAVRLQEIGVTWRTDLDEDWEGIFAMLEKYHRTFGNCRVPKLHNGNRKLLDWIRTQKKLQAKGVLLPERKARLDDIGFPWRSTTSSHVYHSEREDGAASTDSSELASRSSPEAKSGVASRSSSSIRPMPKRRCKTGNKLMAHLTTNHDGIDSDASSKSDCVSGSVEEKGSSHACSSSSRTSSSLRTRNKGNGRTESNQTMTLISSTTKMTVGHSDSDDSSGSEFQFEEE